MATKRLSTGATSTKPSGATKADDTRHLMRQSTLQQRLAGTKRVEHPLARYNKLDQLSCAICSIPVKTEASWNGHLLSKIHRENVEKFKRGETIVAPIPAARSVQTSAIQQMEDDSNEVSNGSDQPEEPPAKLAKNTGEAAESQSNLPTDFFDSAQPTSFSKPQLPEKAPPPDEPAGELGSKLPEGFFDDAKREAKVRQVKFVDKFEDVWSDFQKEIQKETQVSRAIVDEEEDKLFIVRDVAEIDEEIERWARVEALHNKREAQKSKMDVSADSLPQSTSKNAANGDESSSGEGEDFSLEDTLNWRKKKF